MWPLLADTSSLNGHLGLPLMEFEERDGQLFGASGWGPFRQEWVEVPWAWEAGKWLTAERRYSRGPALAVRVRYLLDESDGGTRLAVYIGWIPRAWWARPILRYINRWLRIRYGRVLRELDELAGNRAAACPLPVSNTAAAVDERRLKSAIRTLTDRGFSKIDTDRLADHIRTGPDQQLFRIRPKRLAFEWGMDLEDVLPLLLHSTRSGLLRLSWDVICPHCRGVRREARSLGDLREFSRCDICDIDFEATTLEAVEVTFRVLPEIRVVREIFYCSAEPATKPHILVQHPLEPGENYQTKLALSPGNYRLRRGVGSDASVPFEVTGGQGGESLTWNLSQPASGNAPLALASSFELALTNPGNESVSVVLEKIAEDPTALRPSELFNFQKFRDLFSEESIASGLKLEVGHQTLLFTDIVGSTRLYGKLGDTRAFNLVHAHFVCLQQIIGARRGAVVKTIGDAMMAAFQRPEDALAAAIEIQQEFRGDAEQPLALRASLHRGICLAVRLESNIDYFGNAVNFAAKMQSVAGARQIVLSHEFYAQPAIPDLAKASGLELREVAFPRPSGSGGGETNTVFLASFLH